MTIVVYEVTENKVTGFKIFVEEEVVGTIEKREGVWVGAYYEDGLIQIRDKSFITVIAQLYYILT